jgi:hypothetical protein
MFLHTHSGYAADACPEAGGVNVTDTLRLVGIELEWPPQKIVRQVAIAAVPRSADRQEVQPGLFV